MTSTPQNERLDLGDLCKKMAKIAIPVSLQSLITVAINLADTVMLSGCGDIQLSAATLATNFINIFMICCMGIGMGASVLTSRYWGMKDKLSLKRAITIMLRFTFIFSMIFTLATILIPSYIMGMYTKNSATVNYGVKYLRWLIPTYVAMGFSLTCTIVLRSVGQVRIPLICSISALFVNIFSNWVFIFGNLGAPRMEIEGAALGTLIARVFELLFICGYFFIFDKRIAYKIKDVLMSCKNLIREYVKISIPVLISDGLLALGNSAVAMVMGRIGDTFVSANAVTTVVQQLSSVLTTGVSNASGIITGHTMGQGDYKKAQKYGYAFTVMGFIIGVVAALIILLVKNPIINFYDVTAQTKEIAHQLMFSIMLIMIFQSASSILTKGVLRAGGDTRFLMMGDILFLWIASIPLGALAGLVLNLPSFWIYFFLKIDQIIKCIWCFFRLRSGKWLKKVNPSTDTAKS